MSKSVTLLLNLICLFLGQFAASEILDDAGALWGWSEAKSHFIMKVLLFIQGCIQTALTQIAHYFNPDGSRSA